jgi:heme/copper-type cytochrome/quinol oxidase subunit 2
MKPEDSLTYDSAGSRPLPKWLTDQKEGVTLYKPREIVLKEDHSLTISFMLTAGLVLLSVIFVTIRMKRKMKRKPYE